MKKKLSKLTVDSLYAPKETRTRLGDKSLLAFGTRGKWKKLAERLFLGLNDIEKQMDAINEVKEEQKGEKREQHSNQRVTRRARRKYLRQFAKKMRRNKARFGKGNDGTTTNDSDGRGGESVDVRSEEV